MCHGVTDFTEAVYIEASNSPVDMPADQTNCKEGEIQLEGGTCSNLPSCSKPYQ